MRRILLGMTAALALSACSRTETRPGPAAANVETITYETGPCFGRCPVYRVTVRSDGTGTFTGIRNTAVSGTHQFKLTPAQFLTFRGELEPYLPASGERLYQPGTRLCSQVATDLPSVDIGWTRPRKGASRLYFYYGCDMDKNEAMGQALGNSIDALPIGHLIGDQP